MRYRAFELRPGGAMPDAAKVAMIRANFPRLRALAASLGMPIAEQPARLGVDTRPAHEAAKLVAARAPSEVRAYHQAAFRAHFVELRDLADRAVLRELVAARGVDAAALDEALDAGLYRDDVLFDQAEARANDFHAVPQLVIEGYALPAGMLPADALLDAARQITAARR